MEQEVPNYVKSVQAQGVYGRFDIEHEFQPGVNILFGKNGSGKTTLLHILANILNGNYELFSFLTFDSIQVKLDDSSEVTLHRSGNAIQVQRTDFPTIEFLAQDAEEYILRKEYGRRDKIEALQLSLFDNEFEKFKEIEPPMQAAYFPAFRSMIEAWTTVQQEDRLPRHTRELDATDLYRLERIALVHGRQRATLLARQLFGQFVPSITYPSPLEIEVRLTEEFRKAVSTIGLTNQELFSGAFLDIFAVLSKESNQIGEQPEKILEEILSLFGKLDASSLGTVSMVDTAYYARLRSRIETLMSYRSKNLEDIAVGILDIYRKSLEKRANVQENSFEGLRRYLQAVNEFLEGKNLYIRQKTTDPLTASIQIKFDDGSSSSLRALSSGERQIITMIYVASQMSAQKIVLIDEPEISLHVDWQRLLLKKMSEQLRDRQVIACTHSPVIGADYEDRLMELRLKPTTKVSQEDLSITSSKEGNEEEELF